VRLDRLFSPLISLRFTTEGKLLVVGASVDALRLWEVSLPKRDVKP